MNATTEFAAKPERAADAQPPNTPAKGPSRRRCVVVLVVLLCFGAGCWLFRAPLLTAVAKAWIVSDPLEKADAIAVLGGGLETRPFEAARLYHFGFAPKILIMNQKTSPTTALGITLSEAELTRHLLIRQGVPDSNIVVVGNDIANTRDESLAVREWARSNGARTVIVATDPFHTRRARWVFRKQLKSIGVRVMMDAAASREYTEADWWQSESGVVAFQNEVLKFAYYLLKY